MLPDGAVRIATASCMFDDCGVALSPYATGLVPSYITVAPGATSASFDVTTSVLTSREERILTARHGGTTMARTLEITPPVTYEDVTLYEPGTSPEAEVERRVSGLMLDVYATSDIATDAGSVTCIPWEPSEPTDYSLFGVEAKLVTQPTASEVSQMPTMRT